MRIAITGASGLLGRALIEKATPHHQIIAASHSTDVIGRGSVEMIPLDLNDVNSIQRFVHSSQADLFIHAAATTDVDRCECEPELARALNAEATSQLVAALRDSTSRILYISTDYVFDGEIGPYGEDDWPNPINVYGKTKLEGEKAVLALGARASIVRSASFLGYGGPSRPTFAERMLESMRENPPLRAAFDQLSNVTPVDALAVCIIKLAESGESGIWHIAHPQILSRYDLAVLLADLAGLGRASVESVSYASLHRAAPRPLRGGLKSEKANRVLSLTWRPLKESLTGFL